MNEDKIRQIVREEVSKILLERDKWEIGNGEYYSGVGRLTGTYLVVRRKRRPIGMTPGNFEQTIEINFEELVRRLFMLCNLEVEIKPAVEQSWTLKKKEPAP